MRVTHQNNNNWVGAVQQQSKEKRINPRPCTVPHTPTATIAVVLFPQTLQHRPRDRRALPAQAVRHALPLRRDVSDLLPAKQLRVLHVPHNRRHAPAAQHTQRHNVVPPLLHNHERNAQRVLAHVLHALETHADQVGRHALQLVVLVVLVAPQIRVAGGIAVLEEVRRSNPAGVRVAVIDLQRFQHRQRDKEVCVWMCVPRTQRLSSPEEAIVAPSVTRQHTPSNAGTRQSKNNKEKRMTPRAGNTSTHGGHRAAASAGHKLNAKGIPHTSIRWHRDSHRRHTKQRSKNRSRACEGTHKKKQYSRGAWQK
ncbi:hypothetical protein TcCL_ESM09251 [Trypanosoma cruzi]|nr:hypothetical protein TcCL_ESM09251 [Trypanosoma cruzi]